MVVVELLKAMNLPPSCHCLTINGRGTQEIDHSVLHWCGKTRIYLGNGSYKHSSDPNHQRDLEGNGNGRNHKNSL